MVHATSSRLTKVPITVVLNCTDSNDLQLGQALSNDKQTAKQNEKERIFSAF